ncbi:MAG: Glu-tRNA(Gln) amidotransferase subunit GatD [Candidatus Micrarchaeia archaeon]|jgi:glutamyl-tRNA(Gln) amidotransferase subunit D
MNKLARLLEKHKAEELDRVTVKTSDGLTLEGLVMPRIEYGDTDCLILKLDSGYNAGISSGKIKEMKVLQKAGSKSQVKKAVATERTANTLPKITMIATGGTIASMIDYATGGVRNTLDAEDIAYAIPELSNRVDVSAFHSPFRVWSENMTPHEWKKISEIAAKELDSNEIRGAIVTHGTDTLHFTAAALSFMLSQYKKPIAIVGAQRSPDRGSFDGKMNLACAAAYATSDIGEKAVVMHATTNDDYCYASRGTKVRKLHSSRRDAFQPVNEPALAKIWPDGKIENTNTNIAKREEIESAKPIAEFETKVAVIKIFPSSDPEILDFYASKKYRGIVLEGTGLGHVPTDPLHKDGNWLPKIKKAIDAGMHICMTTQCINGKANPYVYDTGRLLSQAGVQYLSDMLTETAYVKLGWALAQKKNAKGVAELMATNVAGEYNERHEYY